MGRNAFAARSEAGTTMRVAMPAAISTGTWARYIANAASAPSVQITATCVRYSGKEMLPKNREVGLCMSVMRCRLHTTEIVKAVLSNDRTVGFACTFSKKPREK